MNKDKTESRLAILVMILGQMCVSALRLDHKELAENEIDMIISNISQVQSELMCILGIPKDKVIQAMLDIKEMMNEDDKESEELKSQLQSIAYSQGGKS